MASPGKIHVQSRRRSAATLERDFPGAEIVDVTSKGAEPWVRFSPFYPLGGLPVPMSEGVTAESVEGVWQGLKVFEGEGVDAKRFAITSMKGIKRTVRKYGQVLGHARGVGSSSLLSYREARYRIYLPVYRFALEHRLHSEVEQLRELARGRDLVLLDYETNCDPDDTRKPLSHAGLVRAYLEDRWPSE